jgi:hypothetical protein
MYVFYTNGLKLTELCRNMLPQYSMQYTLGVFGGIKIIFRLVTSHVCVLICIVTDTQECHIK